MKFILIVQCNYYLFIVYLIMNSSYNNVPNSNPNSNDTSAAKTIMKAGGTALAVTGYSLSSCGTLYAIKFLSTAGTSVIEFLPHVFNPKSTTTFFEHMSQSNNAGWDALFMISCMFVAGVTVRKFGTYLSDDRTINSAEQFLK